MVIIMSYSQRLVEFGADDPEYKVQIESACDFILFFHFLGFFLF